MQLTFKTSRRLEELLSYKSYSDIYENVKEIISFKNELKEMLEEHKNSKAFRIKLKELIQEIESMEKQ